MTTGQGQPLVPRPQSTGLRRFVREVRAGILLLLLGPVLFWGCASGMRQTWTAAADPAEHPGGTLMQSFETDSPVRQIEPGNGRLYYTPGAQSSLAMIRLDAGTPVARSEPIAIGPGRVRAFAMAGDGRYWVAWRRGGVSAFTATGRVQLDLGLDGIQVTALAYDSGSGDLWAVDTQGQRVLRWRGADSGRAPQEVGSHGAGPGMFNYPIDLALPGDGSVWVLDALNRRVQRFSADGSYRSTLPGTGDPALIRPIALTSDADGELWVLDEGAGTLRCLTSSRVTHEPLIPPEGCTDVAFGGTASVWYACPYEGRVYKQTLQKYGASALGTTSTLTTMPDQPMKPVRTPKSVRVTAEGSNQ